VAVCVCRDRGERLASFSRYAARTIDWPPGDGAVKIEFLADLAARNGPERWVLIPSDDDTAALVARHWDRLSESYRVTTPPWEVVRNVSDKRLLYQAAGDAGVACPRTSYPDSEEDLAGIGLPFPVVLKPYTRVGIEKFTHAKAWRADDAGALRDRFREAAALAPGHSFMVQEMVPGGGEAQFSYAALCQDGRVLASVTACRVRQIPMDFGRFSTYVRSTDEPGVASPARRLIGALRLSGIVEVEFKRDTRDGGFKLLDANPRVWGWQSLCARAGVDFPWLLWRQSMGEEVAEVHGRPGVGWVRVSRDLPTAAREILGGRLAVGEYLRTFRRPVEGAVFAWDDPLPGALELPLSAVSAVRNRLAGRAGGQR
jgi:predicted ATP-grasp superfamily ATP-dependent carboligase